MDMEKKTPSVQELCDAARSGDTVQVAELLRQGVDVNGRAGYWNRTPAHSAAIYGKTEALQSLIAAGANLDLASDSGWTPLHHAARYGHSDCVQQLITAGAQVGIQNKNGRTPLHYAAEDGHSDCVQQLITAGAQVDIQDKDGDTALTHAARKQHTETCKLLLSHSVAVDEESGDTALIAHARRGKTQCCKTLIAAGVDVHHQNIQGDTALIVAAKHKRTKMICKMLISAKINKEHQNHNGKTAADVAEEAGNTEVAACIRQYEAKQAKRSQKKNKEPFDSDYSAPTPALLPMSPGGWDEIMAQSPATWDVANEVLQEDEFTDTISVEEDEKTDSTFAVPAPPLPIHTTHQGSRSPLSSPRSSGSLFDVVTVSGEQDEKSVGTFAVPAQPPPISTTNQSTRSSMPSPRSSSSLFDLDPPLPQTSEQADNHPLHSNPQADVQQETSIKSSDDKIQALLKQLKEAQNIVKEKEETIAQKGDKIKNQEETIANKGEKIKNQEETIANKGDKLVSKGGQIKQQTEIIEETQEKLINSDKKLQGKGKRIYECEEVIEEQEKLLKYKDKNIALKEERITEIEKYQEEQSKKIRIGGDDDEVSNTQKQSLHATKANYKLTPQESRFVLDEILPSICRIEIPGYCGTGFIVGGISDSNTGLTHRYMLTCYHVRVQDALRDQQPCVARFETTSVPIIVNVLTPALFWNKDMDYVMVKLEPSQSLEQLLAGKVALGKLVTVADPVHNDALVLCAHMAEQVIDWGARAVCIDDPEVKRKHGDLSDINRRRQHSVPHHYPLTRKFMYYDCSCQAGTSGAPCLSAPQTRLYAMHCGTAYKERLELEYGVLIKCVVHDIADNIRNWASVPGASNMQQGGLWLDQLSELFPRLSSVIDPNTAMHFDDT